MERLVGATKILRSDDKGFLLVRRWVPSVNFWCQF